jgi:exoribonuclease R
MSSHFRHTDSSHPLHNDNQNIDLPARAERAVRDAGFATRFSPQIIAEVQQLNEDFSHGDAPIRDLRDWQWSSIDNEESQDLTRWNGVNGK